MKIIKKNLSDAPRQISIPHAFYDMTEREEAVLFNLLKEKFADAKRKDEPIW